MRSKKIVALLMSLCLLMGSMPVLPGLSKKVRAAAPEMLGFATKDQLLSDFSMDGTVNKKVQKVYFGQNGNGAEQSWLIAGKDPAAADGLVLFAAAPLKKYQRFDSYECNKKYSEDWECTYKNKPTKVFGNHYGGSELRSFLKSMSSDPAYFSAAEQKFMRKTAIKTEDPKNNEVYTVKDKLYAAYGRSGETSVTVGTNEEDNLDGGLHIDLKKYETGKAFYFWLRSPDPKCDHYARYARPSGNVLDYIVGQLYDVVPALQLDLSSVVFASAAPEASSDDTSKNMGEVLRFRFDAGGRIGSAVIRNHKVAEITGTASDRYLVVQNNSGVWTKKVDAAASIGANKITIGGTQLSSFEGCKVWLEKTGSDKILRAAMAVEKETVIFKDSNGKVLDRQEVTYGESAKEPQAPEKEGYTFIGWDKTFDKITGDVTITAKYKKNSESEKPTKKPHNNPNQPQTTVRPRINISRKQILAGKKFRLSIKNRIGRAKVNYKSNNKKIASVSKSGDVKGLKAGKAVVTTTVNQGGKTYIFTTSVTVKGYVKFIKVKKTIKKGQRYKFKAKAYGIRGELKWSVSKKKIGKISKSGMFKAKKKGKIYLIVKCGKYEAKIRVKIK